MIETNQIGDVIREFFPHQFIKCVTSALASYWRQFSAPSSWGISSRPVATQLKGSNVILPEFSLNTHFTRDKRSDFSKNLLKKSVIYDILSREGVRLCSFTFVFLSISTGNIISMGNPIAYRLHIHKIINFINLSNRKILIDFCIWFNL